MRESGTGTNQAHVALEHIDEVREPVEIELANQAPETGDLWGAVGAEPRCASVVRLRRSVIR